MASQNSEIFTPSCTDYKEQAMIVSRLSACHCVTDLFAFSQLERSPINASLGRGLLRDSEAEWQRENDKFYFAQRNYTFATKCTLCPLFHSLPRSPHSLPSLLRSQGLRQLRRSRAVETHWFRWKEIDVLFIIALSLSCHGERNRWQIIT